jgi:hypothetical protein
MISETAAVPVAILRGGTSRGVFFREKNLPSLLADREALLMNIMGSPDVRQINGLGGATPQTSKIAIVDPSDRDDADVDYTFGQVDITRQLVDWGGNCGNISSAVGPFAINEGLVGAPGGQTMVDVRIYNTNTNKVIIAHVPVIHGRAEVEGDCYIAGVPSPGARLELEFIDPSGSITGVMLPTGNARDLVTLADGWSAEVSIVDAANPSVFLSPESFGLSGHELPAELEAHPGFLDRIEQVRSVVAVWLGLCETPEEATARTPGLPKIGLVSSPRDYETSSGTIIQAADHDLLVRMMSMQFPHRACQITGGIALGVASLVPGSIPANAVSTQRSATGKTSVRLGHPSGMMEVVVAHPVNIEAPLEVSGVAVVRTARHILDGTVHVPQRLLTSNGS